MTPSILITKVTLAPSATITKGMTHSGRKGFIVPVIYTLADGREIPSYQSSEKKKELMPSVERAQNNASRGAMEACFSDDGKFWGTTTKYQIC